VCCPRTSESDCRIFADKCPSAGGPPPHPEAEGSSDSTEPVNACHCTRPCMGCPSAIATSDHLTSVPSEPVAGWKIRA
jgi:hypothetical protein